MPKLLPTSTPKPIPAEFTNKIVAHGWQRLERMFGKGTVAVWVKAIGREKLMELRRDHLARAKIAAANANRARRPQETYYATDKTAPTLRTDVWVNAFDGTYRLFLDMPHVCEIERKCGFVDRNGDRQPCGLFAVYGRVARSC